MLSFHGGPEGQERPVFRADYQAILAQGIAVFAPNIRGSSGFGKAFLALDNHEKRFDANRDVYDSAQYLIKSGVGARLGIVGGSYGGYVVMMAVTEYPDTFAAGANLFGIVNFETFFAQSTPWMGAISGGEYGDPKTQADLLKRLSPIHKLDRVRARDAGDARRERHERAGGGGQAGRRHAEEERPRRVPAVPRRGSRLAQDPEPRQVDDDACGLLPPTSGGAGSAGGLVMRHTPIVSTGMISSTMNARR